MRPASGGSFWGKFAAEIRYRAAGDGVYLPPDGHSVKQDRAAGQSPFVVSRS